jgi:hypothetical protein
MPELKSLTIRSEQMTPETIKKLNEARPTLKVKVDAGR